MITSPIVEICYFFVNNHRVQSLFMNFLAERESLVILGILMFSLGIIGRNYLALITQTLLFIGLWIHFCSYKVYYPLLIMDNKFLLIHSITLFVFFFIQISAFLLTIWDLIKVIEKESPEK
ncbi:hypothetical protein [Bacillus cereus group sp. TH152-1LC]|uniref:hypothetical protein n=1 Tax=Bacillus cereus group sp. TH152-1LC TaxID=3018060 RepID=UPI0022E45749|nr:hypothetical protein [Bacillus cereus group sp. TH152-1LC]MDA1674518.1 hypothetical protein [Bacillus cereus group sp. TH152-1LC]